MEGTELRGSLSADHQAQEAERLHRGFQLQDALEKETRNCRAGETGQELRHGHAADPSSVPGTTVIPRTSSKPCASRSAAPTKQSTKVPDPGPAGSQGPVTAAKFIAARGQEQEHQGLPGQ